jgi:hypothetical protein
MVFAVHDSMAAPPVMAQVKLVTIIAASELEERLMDDLRGLGIRAYTTSRAGGSGLHGRRQAGIWEMGNIRVETLVDNDLALRVMAGLVRAYKGQSLIAFTQTVEAVPHEHFQAPGSAA